MQHSCSHYNAFCSIPWQTCTYLRTWQHQMTTIMQPFQCYLQPEIQEPHRTTHTDITTRCKTHRRNTSRQKRPQLHPPHTRGTFHCRLQPLYTEKHKVSCSGFLSKTKPMGIIHASSPLPFVITSPSSPLPFVTTSHRHHFPSSPPCVIATTSHVPTSLPHHSPSSPLPSSPLPSSPLPIVTTSLPHHSPSSPLPFLTTSLPHHFPSSPLPIVTTSLPHHFPSSPLPIVTTSHHSQFHCFLFFCDVLLAHHFPSSPLPIVTTTSHHSQFHCFLFFCDVSLDHAPPFIIVNSITSYSFVMYC